MLSTAAERAGAWLNLYEDRVRGSGFREFRGKGFSYSRGLKITVGLSGMPYCNYAKINAGIILQQW